MVDGTATGSFEVSLVPAAVGDGAVGAMTIDKTLTGGIDGVASGIMIAARTEETGAAGYSALERITGTLDGRAGSFVLHHLGVMDDTGYRLDVAAVAGSATGALIGLAGTMTIEVADGRHNYTFRYSLPA